MWSLTIDYLIKRSLPLPSPPKPSAQRPPTALVLQSGFSSAADVACAVYGFLPIRHLMKDQWQSTTFARALPSSLPSLCMHGRQDEIVPYAIGQRLHDSLPGPKFFVPFDSFHNDIVDSDPEKWVGSIERFLTSYVHGGGAGAGGRGDAAEPAEDGIGGRG